MATSQNAATKAAHTRVSLHTTDEPSAKPTCGSKTAQNVYPTLYETTPITTAIQPTTNRESEAPTEVFKVRKTSAVAITTVKQKPTKASKTPEGTIPSSIQNIWNAM